MRISPEQRRILAALKQGCQLKVHRTADGRKEHRLHGLPDASSPADTASVDADAVARLEAGGFVESNMKFPAATFLLTEKGSEAAAHLTGSPLTPTGPRNYR